MAATTIPRTSAAIPSASQTQTITSLRSSPPPQPVLRLRGAIREPGERSERRIQWAEDVIDNEGLGRKSSKVCCIYHAPKAIDESSDESSSSSSSDSDSSDNDDGSARPVGGNRRSGSGKRGRKPHDHDHGHDHGDECGRGGPKRKGKGRAVSPNAYEKVPKPKTTNEVKKV